MYHANVCANYYNRVKFADKLDDMTLTTVLHSIFMEADKDMIKEFQEQTEAMRMLRAKFRYPMIPTAKEARTAIERLQLILKTTSQTLIRDQFEIWHRDTRIHDDTNVNTPDPEPESLTTSSTVISLKIEIDWFNLDHRACKHTLTYIFGLDLILLQSIMLHFVSFITSTLGIDLLVESQGKIKLNPDFAIYFYGRQVTKLKIHVGRRGTILGHATPSQPTSTYKAGTNLASHTSLDRVDEGYTAFTDHSHLARQNQRKPNTITAKYPTHHSLYRVECFLNTKKSTMISHQYMYLTIITTTDEATLSCISNDTTSGPAFQEFIQVSFGRMHLLNNPYARKKSSDVKQFIDKQESSTHVSNVLSKDFKRTTILPGLPQLSNHFSSDACLLGSKPSKLATSLIAPGESERHLIQPKSSITEVSPKRVSEIEERVSEYKESENQDPKGGRVYFTQTTTIKSNLRVSPSSHHDQNIPKIQPPSELEANKIGLMQSISPMLENPQNRPFKETKGKKITLLQTTTVKKGTTIITQPLDQGNCIIKAESESTNRVNFAPLDFSRKEFLK